MLIEKKVWISWEDHRRSRVLSEEFGCKYIPLTLAANRALRYPVLVFRTLSTLIKERPKYLFCQNPSVILAALCVLLRPFFNYVLIIDRHSNFKFETRSDVSIKWKVFHLLSDFSIRRGDFNIVTNYSLKEFVEEMGGVAVVLPDKIPDLVPKDETPYFFKDVVKSKIICITMFDDDEPIEELITAGSQIQDRVSLYLTGNFRKMYSKEKKSLLENNGVFFCGFVDEDSYISALCQADVIVVLTKKNYILNCGAYEAFSLCKPLILSDTATLREYFGAGPIYVNPEDPESIAQAVLTALENKESIRNTLCGRRDELIIDWYEKFNEVQCRFESKVKGA